jgi:hypothetical protein
VPPGRTVVVTDTVEVRQNNYDTYYRIQLPYLHLHCTSPACNGLLFFAPEGYYEKSLRIADIEQVQNEKRLYTFP